MEGGGAKGSSLFSGDARSAKELSALQERKGTIFKRLGFEHPSLLGGYQSRKRSESLETTFG